MNLRRFIAASLHQHRRAHLPVILGVAVATAVLTGALLVGDSVRGSLRGLTLERLGRIDQAVVAARPFRVGLADELMAAPGFGDRFAGADAAFLLRGSLSSTAPGGAKRYAGGVAIVGVTDRFVDHGPTELTRALAPGSVALTSPLASELGVDVGDEVVLRLPTIDALPADSPLGEKLDTTIGKRLTVAQVLKPRGLARFSLTPSQADPRNAFVPLPTVQSLVDQPGKANTLLVTAATDQASPPGGDTLLAQLLKPSLEDYGIEVSTLATGAIQIESEQLVLPDAVVQSVVGGVVGGVGGDARVGGETNRGADAQKVVSYLANTLRVGDASISYSTVAGVDSRESTGPLLDGAGQPIVLGPDEIALNDWAAARLEAQVGDTVEVTYYEPESTHGELVTAPTLRLRLRAIAPLAGDDGRPTPAADPRLIPRLEGVTDADSIDDWDLPFELTEPITDDDEDYWDEHATTPKALVSFDLAERLWATRWGSVSLIRLPAADDADAVAEKLRRAIDPAEAGFAFLPVKRQGLAASGGTTPFDGLFFGFSMFLIASSIALIALLFGLGVENRSRELGLLAAVGWNAPRVRAALTREGLIVALLGVCVGVPAGVVYAGAMVWGLTTLWVEAIVAPFLTLHVGARSLVIGGVAGLLVAWLTIRRVAGGLLRIPARGLLAGQTSAATPPGRRSRPRLRRLATAVLLLAGVLAAFASTMSGEAQAGAFFGSGAAALTGLLLLVRATLLAGGARRAAPVAFGLWSLATCNVARNATRSVLTLSLVASASFLILAISAFQLSPTADSGGGFTIVGQSDQPIHYDLNTERGRLELGLGRRDEELLDLCRVYALRVYDGEDASCLNLYRTRQPRVLGAPDAFLAEGRFAFAAGEWPAPEQRKANAADAPSPTPVVLDFNTATYSLQLYGGVGGTITVRDEADRPTDLAVAGLLKNSLLQGDLILREIDFLRLFPSASGSRFFLIKPKDPATDLNPVAAMLEDRLSDYGLDLEPAELRLARFFAVQNTYLSTFQTLGALGLLLGAVGVAVVQMRNLAERRGELGLLRAGGFPPARLRALVLRENLLLLGGGLLIGAAAATVALAPQLLAGAAAGASLPWAASGVLLAVILAVGLVVGAAATGRALRAPIVPALRGD